jgi:ABC-type phosphate transport system substrate-binding protein
LSTHVTLLSRIAAALLALGATLTGAEAGADVVAVVSAKSDIKALTANQVADIFLGRVSRFPNGLLAVPIDRRDGSPERDQFYIKIAGKTPAQVKAYWSKIIFTGRGQPPKAVLTDLDVKKIISMNTAAIGYIDAALLDDSVRAL